MRGPGHAQPSRMPHVTSTLVRHAAIRVCANFGMCTSQAAAFDPNKSVTSRWLGCVDKRCLCGSPACSCKEQTCYYTRHYGEHVSQQGPPAGKQQEATGESRGSTWRVEHNSKECVLSLQGACMSPYVV